MRRGGSGESEARETIAELIAQKPDEAVSLMQVTDK